MKADKGFTLAEILIAVSVAAALAGIAAVNYSSHLRQSEKSEAVVNMHNIRLAERIYRSEKGVFVNAQDTAEINQLLGAGIQEKLFKYQIINADQADFMIIAQRLTAAPANQPQAFSMDADGTVRDLFLTAGGLAVGSTGSILGSASSGGGGSSSAAGITSGGSSGSGAASGSGGGGGGSTQTITIGSSDSITESSPFTTSTVCDYDVTGGLSFISRCDDMFTDWSADTLNITGSGAGILQAVYDVVNNSSDSGINSISEDIFSKGLLISFGNPSDFDAGGLCENSYACFAYTSDPAPGPPEAPATLPSILFNPTYQDEDEVLLAAILVHEGTHFQQFLDGDAYNPDLTTVDVEFRAFWNASHFWSTVRDDFGPPFDETALEEDLEYLYQLALLGEAEIRTEIELRYT